MGCNLDVEFYRDGTPIPEVTDSTTWEHLTTGAWCYYNNDPAMGAIYGKLYNWYAVIDPRGLAPDGWHVPSNIEWTELETCIGEENASVKLKTTGTIEDGDGLWRSPNRDASNESGFSALPGGQRNYKGSFSNIGYNGNWQSSLESGLFSALSVALQSYDKDFSRVLSSKYIGYSVRCVRDY
jgi:uncharacterized protein (TIGR02145 family)